MTANPPDGDGIWAQPPNQGRAVFLNQTTGERIELQPLEIRLECEGAEDLEILSRQLEEIRVSMTGKVQASSRTLAAILGIPYRFKRACRPVRRRARRQ